MLLLPQGTGTPCPSYPAARGRATSKRTHRFGLTPRAFWVVFCEGPSGFEKVEESVTMNKQTAEKYRWDFLSQAAASWMASCSAVLKQSWMWPIWIWWLYNVKKRQGLCYRHLSLSQCYGQLITTFLLPLMGEGSDTQSENPPKKIVLSELQPVSLNIIHPWVFPLRWFWPINRVFVLFLFGFLCFICLFATSL